MSNQQSDKRGEKQSKSRKSRTSSFGKWQSAERVDSQQQSEKIETQTIL